jgi:hypothetical protein
MDVKKKKYVTLGLVSLGLVAIYFMAAFVVPRMFVTLTKAAPATRVSVADSYILGQRILARADGKDKCLINVFILDKSGKGVQGKRVVLEGVEGINAIKDMTGSDGKASFEITSVEEGQYNITAMVEGIPLTKQVRVTFRN